MRLSVHRTLAAGVRRSQLISEFWASAPIRAFGSANQVKSRMVEDAPCYSPPITMSSSRAKASSKSSAVSVAASEVKLQTVAAVGQTVSDNFSERILRVESNKMAKKVLRILKKYPDKIWACDTEVTDIDLANVGPVGNGSVTCISIYGGPDVDFGEGKGKNVLWIDNIDENKNMLSIFSQWFSDERYKKVWHNYGFDRHVMYNEGIDCRGFGGDTMHMARLMDTGRSKLAGGGGYSLASLSSEMLQGDGEGFGGAESVKVGMSTLFGIPRKLSSGDDSKILDLPSVRSLQTNPASREKWIEYSSRDALATWNLYTFLKQKLEEIEWWPNEEKAGNMFDFYQAYWLPFGEILTELERNGIRVDLDKLRASQIRAEEDAKRMEKIFMDWAAVQCEGGRFINPSSRAQISQLLFGKYVKGNPDLQEKEVEFEVDKTAEQLAVDEDNVNKLNPFAGNIGTL